MMGLPIGPRASWGIAAAFGSRRARQPGLRAGAALRRDLTVQAGPVEKLRRRLPRDPDSIRGHLTQRLLRVPSGASDLRVAGAGRVDGDVGGSPPATSSDSGRFEMRPLRRGFGPGEREQLVGEPHGTFRPPATRVSARGSGKPMVQSSGSKPSRGKAQGSNGWTHGGNAKRPQRTRRWTKTLRPRWHGRAQPEHASLAMHRTGHASQRVTARG